MAHPPLTAHAITRAQNNDTSGSPVVQIVEVKEINQTNSRRFRLLISDGLTVMQAMLATQLNGTVDAGQIQTWSVVRLDEFICNIVQNRKVAILLNVATLAHPGACIGNPLHESGAPVLNPAGAPPQANGAPPPGAPPPAYQHDPYAQGAPPPQPNAYYQQGAHQPPPPQQYGAPAHQQPPQYGAPQRDQSATIVPVSALNPYQNKWTIRARVMEKDTRNYSNAKGDGKLFNLLAADTTGDIRLTGFNETHDAHYDKIVIGRVYDISGGTLKPKNAQYNTTSHGFEITLNRSCTFDEVEEPGGHEAIPKYSFRFTALPELETAADDSKVDVLGVIADIGDPQDFTAKSGKEMTKRVMQLVDQSGRGIECTIFGKPSQTLGQGYVVALKAAKVGSWNSKSLTLWTDAAITPHPDMPEAHALLGWWQQGGQQQPVHMISISGGGGSGGGKGRRMHFSDIEDLALGLNGEPDVFTVRATVTHIKTEQRTMWYIACPTCKKKVQGADEDNLQGHCEKCDKSVMGARRWIFSALCCDTSGSRYVSFFDDQAVGMLDGKTADELAPLKNEGNEAAYGAHFLSSSFKTYMMKCRAKSETYMEEQKLKISAIHLTPMDWREEGRTLLADIHAMQGQPALA